MESNVPWLIAGLGNPGSKYEKTWHNAGFMTLEVLAQKHGIRLNRIKFKGLYGQGSIKGEKAVLLKPSTYMNLSGESVREAADFFKIPLERIVLIYDDIDVERGQIRIRRNGSAGTHNGMKSVIERLAAKDFPRIRVGTGPLPERWQLIDYVLSEIPKEEQETMFQSFTNAAEATEILLEKGIAAAMNRYNGKENGVCGIKSEE